jgi:hypothetical protein
LKERKKEKKDAGMLLLYLNLVAIVTRGFLLIIGYGWFTIDFVL